MFNRKVFAMDFVLNIGFDILAVSPDLMGWEALFDLVLIAFVGVDLATAANLL